MKIAYKLRNRVLAATAFGLLVAWGPAPAHATSKDMVELQTQVQQLLDMMQRMQSTLDTRFGVLQHLAEQTADNANQVTQTVNALQQKLNAQNEAFAGKLDTTSGQVQSLNDSIDELKSRIAKMDKSIQDLQGQLQNSPAGAQPLPGGSSPAGLPSGSAPAGSQVPPLQETLQGGIRDYNAAKYEVATGEFQDVLHYYPMDEASGIAQFYLGEIAYRQQNYAEAIKDYNAVLEGFSGSPKAPAAQLRKGLALLQMNKKAAGVQELRQLVQRHPQTPEATQARSKLNALGVRAAASH